MNNTTNITTNITYMICPQGEQLQPPQCVTCNIDKDYGLNWDGECQACSQHLPVAIVINILTSVMMNLLCTYAVQLQSVRTVYLKVLQEMKFYPFSRLRPPFIMQGAYCKLFLNYLNYQSIFLYMQPLYMHVGMGSIGGIQGVVWFEDCYFKNLSDKFSVQLLHLPVTVSLIFLLFIIQVVLGTMLNKLSGIELKSFYANQLYQMHWYLTVGAPTITLVFLPYVYMIVILDDTGSHTNPSSDCSSNTYTGLRWGMAFLFLLIQWIFLPYRTIKTLFVKRFELDRDLPTILNLGGSFLEYNDDYFFWDCVKYFLKAACITFIVTLYQYTIVSTLMCILVISIYILIVYILKPYKAHQLMAVELMLMIITVISFACVTVINEEGGVQLSKAMAYIVFMLQCMATFQLMLIILTSFCFPKIHQYRLLSVLVGVAYRPSNIRFPKVKHAWDLLRTMIRLNHLLKKLKRRTRSNYDNQAKELENYSKHIKKELFIDSQNYRKRLGFPLERNYQIESPYEVYNNLKNNSYIMMTNDNSMNSMYQQSYSMNVSTVSPDDMQVQARSTKRNNSEKKETLIASAPSGRPLHEMPSKKASIFQSKIIQLRQLSWQENISFLFNKGVLLTSPQIKISFESKVKIIPLSEMKNFLLKRALEKELIDTNMEKDFAVNAEKPLCLKYELIFHNQEDFDMTEFKLALDDEDDELIVYLNEDLKSLTPHESMQMTISLRINLDDVQKSVTLVGQFKMRGSYYQFSIKLCRSLIKMAELKQIEKSNQQFKNKIKFTPLHQPEPFYIVFDRLKDFQESYPKIQAKMLQMGQVDMQFMWKYYFPLKFMNSNTYIFFYNMLIDSGNNRCTIIVYKFKEDQENDHEKKKINIGISELIKSFLSRYDNKKK